MNSKSIISRNTETPAEVTRQLRAVAPEVDILENENEIVLYADLPGVTREKLTVHIDDGKLTVSGLREMHHSGATNWEEFGNVEFRRVFSVPQTIDLEGVNAELRDGVLRLQLPKSAAAKPRTIEIKGA